MKTVTHEEYLLLNSIQRDGYLLQEAIPEFDKLKRKRWIERCRETEWESFGDEINIWRLSSAGRLEHNLYEKIHRYTDGCRRK